MFIVLFRKSTFLFLSPVFDPMTSSTMEDGPSALNPKLLCFKKSKEQLSMGN